jgi:MFS family permease
MDAAPATTRRDAKISGLIGVAHFFSHYYQLSLPALFPLIHADTGIGYTALGALVSIFYFTSGVLQTPGGFLVDRIGGRHVLIGGMILLAGSTALYGITQSYWIMMVLAVLGGAGNSIFHPADYSILSANISDARIGRAYSVHGFVGFGGYAAAPMAMLALGTIAGWRWALIIAGMVGFLVVLVLHLQRHELGGAPGEDAAGSPETAAESDGLMAGIRMLLQAPVVLCFTFFMLVAMGQVGMMTLGPATMIALLETPLAVANGAVSTLMAGIMAGIAVGGVIADRQDRHDLVTGICVTITAGLFLLIPVVEPRTVPSLWLFAVAGLVYGITGPARDMMVRSVSTATTRGKVFGFTYSGLDFGSAVSGVLFGAILDAGRPEWVFRLIPLFMMVSIASLLTSQFLVRRLAGKGT